MAPRVFVICYSYPPVGGAGVQRVVKFVKYLPSFGWLPTVLTVANPSVPLLDNSLTADVPSATPVHRAKTWEPGNALKTVVSAGSEGAAGKGGRAGRLLKRLARQAINLILQPDPQILWL